ncbi:unnamed protein product, partial [marine sediment metagenome]
MPRVGALTTAQVEGIQDGSTSFDQYILTCPNTVVFSCQINEVLSATYTASFTYDGVVVGAYTDA